MDFETTGTFEAVAARFFWIIVALQATHKMIVFVAKHGFAVIGSAKAVVP